MPGADRRPADEDGADEADDFRFAETLARFDEALLAGDETGSDTVSDGLDPRLLVAQGGLRLLEEAWPRSPAVGRGLPGTGAADPGGNFDRFRILRRLGSGGGGVVFLAEDPRLGRKVALKLPLPEALLTPDRRERFLREARAAAGLDHPNLVPIYEAGEVGPVCYIASAYCEGPTLGDWIRKRGRPAPPCPRRPWSPGWPTPSITPTNAASCTATSSRRTSCWCPGPIPAGRPPTWTGVTPPA